MRTILVISLCLAPWSVSAQTIVTNDAELRAAILAATAGTTIQLGADITLLGDLPAIAQNITFDGAGHTLSGNNLYRGLMVANLSGGGAIPSPVAVTIQNVSITNTVATGGTGGAGAQGGGGGGGLGGGLFVAASANVTLSNVSITNSQAIGGNGGAGGVPGAGNGGGGGLGGNGGAGGFFGSAPYDGGGGGAGVGASGGSNSAGAAGILTGGAAGGAAAGGPVQPGGTAGGGGGSNLTGAGGGGAGGAGGAGGDGGYGGGGAGSAASGGAGGVGGGGGAGTLGTGGYGGGGGGTFFTFANAGGFAGGASGNSPTAGGGGGGGLGGGIFVEGGGTLNITGGLTVNGNAVAAGNGGAGGAAGSSGLSGGSGIFFGGSGIINFAPTAGVSQGVGDVIADEAGTGGSFSVALGKAGAGTLTLSGQNTYTGGTVISGGTLSVSSSGNLGSSSSAITIDGGTLATTATNTFTQVVLLGAGTVSASAGTVATFSTQFGDSAGAGPSGGQLTVTGGGTVVLTSPDNSYTGGTTIVGNSTVLVASDAGLGDAAGGVTLGDAGSRGTLGFLTGQSGTAGRNISIGSGGGVIDTQGTADMRVSGNVTSSGGLTKTGTGTLTLGGSNTYSGGTVVNAGTLVAGGIDVFGTGSMQIDTGATLNLADNNQTFGSLAGAGTVVMGNGTVTAGGNNTSTTFSGVLGGTGGLVKNGTGTMTLTGANFYTGDTTINGGTLAGDTTSLQGNILDNAVLQFNQAAAGTFAGTVSGTGSLTKTGAGTLTLTGANSYSGGTLISAGTLAGDTTSLQGNIQDNAALLFNQTANGLFTGAISGTGSVTKNGAGTLVLNGANTYTGGTTVNAGVLYGDATSLQGAIVNNTTVVFDQAGAGTYAGTMSGSGSLLKFGTGTLSLNGANTYSGGTLISSGTLIGSSTSLQGDIQNDAALVFNQATNGTYAGTMAGSGSLTKTGAGTLTLTGANAHTGGTTISAGTLAGDTTSLQGNIQDDAVLQFNQAAAGTFAGTISGTGSLTKTGAGTLTLTGANSYNGGTLISAGTLAGDTTSLQGNIQDNAALLFNQTANGLFTGAISGTGSVTKNGAGTLVLNGANTYTGGTLVAGGTLIGSATSLQGDIQNDAQVIFNQTADGTYAGNMAGTGSLTKSGAGTLTLTGATGYSGGTFITAGTLEGNSANLQGSISNLGQLRFNQALDGTFTGSIGGTGSVTKTGAGMLVLNGANAYTGGTTVSGGSLVGDVTSLQGDILNDATLVFNQLSDATFTGNLSGSGVLVKAGGATLTLGGSNTQTGGTVIQGGALVANTTNLFGPVLDNGSLVFNQNAAGVFGGSIVGSGSLTKSGAGTLTLTGFNSYGGGTFITGGTLVGSTQSLQGSIANGGQLVFAQNFDGIFNGSIFGIGSVVKDGAGTLFLNGANTYTGGTTLNAGGLFGTTSSLQGAILNNGVVTFSQNADGTYAGNMSGSGSLVKAGTGTLTLSGTNLFTGGTVVSGGAISLAQDAALGAAAGGVSLGDALSSATMTFTNGVQLSSLRGFTLAAGGGIFNTTGAQVTLSGGISGAGGLTKTGAGVLELAQSNSYTGPTVVTDGTLRAGAAGAFGNGGTLLVNAGGAVNLNGFAQSVGSLSGSGSFFLGSGTLTAGVGNASSAFAGALSGSGSLIKAGSGTLFLSGSNTYSGGTTVLGGLLAGTTSSVQGNIVNNGAVLFDQNAAGTYSGSMSGSGSLFKSGSGLLTLTGSNTYSGGTVIAGGGIFASASSLSGTILNDGMLGFGGASSGVFNGIIGGAGTLTKSGTGTVTMNGPQALTGLTTVAQGTLALNGGIAGSVDVASGATLRVNGFIGGSLSVGGSLFAVPPGGALSTPSMQSTNAGGTALDSAPYLGVGGNFTALNGSRVSFEVGPGTNPTILVGGSANINGAQFDVTAPAIGNQRVTTFLALAALNGLTFANAGIAVDQANVEPILKQTQNSLFVTLLNLNVPLSIDGGAGNRPVADAIDRTKFDATGDARTVVRELTALDAAGLQDALEQLGGELHASVLHTAILDAETMADVVRDQLAWREMEGGNDFQWWGDTTCQRADFKGTNNARGGQANVCTGAGGGDRRFSDKWTLGFGGSWTDGSMGLGDLGKGDYTAPRAFGYAGYKPKYFGVRFGGSGAKSNYDTKRQIQFQAFLPPELGGLPLDVGIDRKAEAEQKGNTSDQWSEIHDSTEIKTYTIEGLFGMRHARISRASFIESGALSISLDGEDEILDLTQTDVKVKFWRREGTYRPFGDFNYRRELAADGTQAAVRFDGLPESDFIVQGINIPTSTYSLRGGMNIMFPFGQATMTYEYKRAEGQKRQTVGFRMRFK